jgi:hypothetical protein
LQRRDTAIIKFSFIQNISDDLSLQDCGSFFINSGRDKAIVQFSLGKNISDALSLQDCGSFFIATWFICVSFEVADCRFKSNLKSAI